MQFVNWGYWQWQLLSIFCCENLYTMYTLLSEVICLSMTLTKLCVLVTSMHWWNSPTWLPLKMCWQMMWNQCTCSALIPLLRQCFHTLESQLAVTNAKLITELEKEINHYQNMFAVAVSKYFKPPIRNNKLATCCVVNVDPVPTDLAKLDSWASNSFSEQNVTRHPVVRLGTYTGEVPVYSSLKSVNVPCFSSTANEENTGDPWPGTVY